MNLGTQITLLFVFAIPVACIAWTVTHEEVFREPREFCVERSQTSPSMFMRKFFYLFTCEYCFSHYVTILFLLITEYAIWFDDWRGYLISFFSLVWVANIYMSIFSRLRLTLKKERVEIKEKEEVIKEKEVANGRHAA
ncbi:MAG: hypothetical protein EHM58_15945 [Ignavibacteriae bacterium]|nr:MAG: hypothetical protein EHM58_15945 [Ignavibacteriota bacterium]